MPEVKLEQFEGPLDLLLKLIEEEELSISEISLARITEQFVARMEEILADRPEELADFLVIATRLLYMKSRALLPYLYPEEDDGPSLAEQLKLYRAYVEASKTIARLWERGMVAYPHTEPPRRLVGVFPTRVTIDHLYEAMRGIVKRLAPTPSLPHMTMDPTVSVRQAVVMIRSALDKLRQCTFQELTREAKNRSEIIVSFLAILQLTKDQSVTVEQEESFGNMQIAKM